MKNGFDQYYDEATEPGKRERAYAWATAIGLQDVDGLKPSQHLYETARRHIEGEITQEEARRIVDEYYETKDGHDLPPDTQEADKVASRMIAVLNSPTFSFSPAYFLGLHQRIFEGIFPHAGQIRSVELTKHEEVLNGASVGYAPSFMIERALDYDFERERKFDYRGLSEDAFVAHFAAFIAGIWQIHPFREGNTRTTAMFAIKYLRSKGFDVTNDLFARESWYFRNALVRANYENAKLDIVKDTIFIEEFLKVLLYGHEIELKNRYLRVGQERGSKVAKAIAGLHRRKKGDVGINVGLNVGLNETEEAAVNMILQDPKVTAIVLAKGLKVEKRHAERVIASLKKKAGLKRRGARKNGEWYFEGEPTGY